MSVTWMEGHIGKKTAPSAGGVGECSFHCVHYRLINDTTLNFKSVAAILWQFQNLKLFTIHTYKCATKTNFILNTPSQKKRWANIFMLTGLTYCTVIVFVSVALKMWRLSWSTKRYMTNHFSSNDITTYYNLLITVHCGITRFRKQNKIFTVLNFF